MVVFSMMGKSYMMLMVATNMNGFACLAQYSVAYEMSVGIARHLHAGEATIGGLINMLANLLGCVLVLALTPFLNYEQVVDVQIANGVLFGVLALALVLMALVRYSV